MKKMLRSAAALSLASCMMSANVLAATTFSDVPGHWGASYINRAVEKGLVSGMGDGTYGVDKTLSAAQFTTMICNLFYKNDVTAYSTQYASQLSGQPWWYSYMSVAYEKGLLTNTVVGNYRKNYTAWAKDLVEGEVSRYDMAQILINVVDAQKWQAASAWDVLSAQTSIKDWSTIPQQYQSAVANAYARGFLSGMGDGSFSGASAMTRAQGAVVLCKLLDAQTKEKENTYTNTVNLVNGKTPTRSNVKSAVSALKASYPKNMVWNGTNTYTSGVLGGAYGCDAYSYTISDKVFGNLKVSKVTDHEDMKPGDLLYLNSLKCHVVITNVDGDDFDYTYCTSNGAISWSGYGDIDDLTSKDILYTRYDDDSVEEEEALSNGKKATESNVEDLIEDFLDDEYDYGDEWDNTYKTDSFSTTSKTYSKDQAFAYYLSDYIFDDLEAEEVDDFDDLRIGDVLYVDSDDMYVVVTDISGDTLYCIGVDEYDEVSEYTLDMDDLDYRTDSAYTRYPTDDEDEEEEEEEYILSNGKSPTESNVEDLIEDFLDEEYDDGSDYSGSYTTDSFSTKSRKYYDSEAFAYEFSDYIFDELEVRDVDDFDDLRIGDVIYWDEEELYLVVLDISGDTIEYISVDDEEVFIDDDLDVDDLGNDDWACTRYPTKSSLNKNRKLSNGKDVTEANVLDLLEEFEEDEYSDDEQWDMTKKYNFDSFDESRVTGSRAFAYYLSDYIFDELEVEEIDFEDIRVGDVLELSDEDIFGVVVDVDERNNEITYVAAKTVGSKGKVSWDETIDMDDLEDGEDVVYSRYLTSEEKLSNGKSVTANNIKALLNTIKTKDAYKAGATWNMNTNYNTKLFGRCSKDQAFAAMVSDEVFGDLDDEELDEVSNIRVGDVVLLYGDEIYAVVTDVYSSSSTKKFDYAYADPDDGKIYWGETMKVSELKDGDDEVYTRYPS